MRRLSLAILRIIALSLPFASSAAMAGGSHKGGHAHYEFGAPVPWRRFQLRLQ